MNQNINNTTDKLDDILKDQSVVFLDIIIMEILKGVKFDKKFIETKDILNRFICYNCLTKETAILSAKNYRILRNKGITIRKSVDVIIATFCINFKIPLPQNDKDFLPFRDYLGLELL